MHDLNTINRLNLDAFAASVNRYRADGRHVIAAYEGAYLMSIETFTVAAEAQTRFDELNTRLDGTHARLFLPTAGAQASAAAFDAMQPAKAGYAPRQNLLVEDEELYDPTDPAAFRRVTGDGPSTYPRMPLVGG